jgi:hypothetical protein
LDMSLRLRCAFAAPSLRLRCRGRGVANSGCNRQPTPGARSLPGVERTAQRTLNVSQASCDRIGRLYYHMAGCVCVVGSVVRCYRRFAGEVIVACSTRR